MPRVCVDANLVVARVLPDERSDGLETLWSLWQQENIAPFGPPLLYAEVPSVLRGTVHFGRISAAEGDRAFQDFHDLGIAISTRADLHILAWALAKEHNRPSADCDAMYLAAAQAEGCELWTGDRRLVNAVNLPWVRWIGEAAPLG
ncbi:MAG: hypothetical protein BZY88_07270 [SAR202 cluster bacterium Io17-Chloro-G9]|nr:MAG: hypothetical protein BZY88_07270 [SAR202 cluster bacterium Io17-Chloro-G9]